MQRQRDLLVGGQGGVAAGEDELEPLIGDLAQGLNLILDGGARVGQRGQRLVVEGCGAVTAAAVDGLAASRDGQPRAGVARGLLRPALDGGQEGVLQGILGQVEVAQPADEGGENLARLAAVGALDGMPLDRKSVV